MVLLYMEASYRSLDIFRLLHFYKKSGMVLGYFCALSSNIERLDARGADASFSYKILDLVLGPECLSLLGSLSKWVIICALLLLLMFYKTISISYKSLIRIVTD